jgi:hypothetical protein
VIAAQWATGRTQKQNIDHYKSIATQVGLVPDVDFIFTSDFESPKFDVGIPKRFLRELMLCANVFIFPTREESFGLIFPEVCLSSAVIPLANKSLRMLGEVAGNNGLFFDFGSFHHSVTNKNTARYFSDMAGLILGRMEQNESVKIKTYMRQTYNYDNLYYREYEPLFSETRTW